MADRIWTDTQLQASFFMMPMVVVTGRCSSAHPFSVLSAFIGCTAQISEVLGIEGSHRLFTEGLCTKMGYDYGRIMAGLTEPACRLNTYSLEE